MITIPLESSRSLTIIMHVIMWSFWLLNKIHKYTLLNAPFHFYIINFATEDKNPTFHKACILSRRFGRFKTIPFRYDKCETCYSIYSNILLYYFFILFLFLFHHIHFIVSTYRCTYIVILYITIMSVIADNRKIRCLWVTPKQVGRPRSRRQVADTNIRHIRSVSHASCSICSGYPIRDACAHATAWLTQWFSESLRPSWNPAWDFCRSLGPVT